MPTLRVFLLALVLFASAALEAKNTKRPMSPSSASTPSTESTPYSKAQISVELLGPGIFGSMNGSYRPIPELAVTSGLGYFDFDLGLVKISSINVPLYASWLLGGKSHFLEVLAGGIIAFVNDGNGSANASSNVQDNLKHTGILGLVGLGYRYWPWDGGFHFRLTGYMLFRNSVAFWPGLTFGCAF